MNDDDDGFGLTFPPGSHVEAVERQRQASIDGVAYRSRTTTEKVEAPSDKLKEKPPVSFKDWAAI